MDATACAGSANMKAKLQQQKQGADPPRRRRRPASSNVHDSSAPAGRAGRPPNNMIGKKSSTCWERDQGVQLSRLVLGFARSCRRLPDAGDRSFWQLCYKRFEGIFTCKQVQSKVRYLHLRFHRLASGAAKTLHLQERTCVQIWTSIMKHILPTDSSAPREDCANRSTSIPCSSRSLHRHRSTSPCSSRSRSHEFSSEPSYEDFATQYAGAGHDPTGLAHEPESFKAMKRKRGVSNAGTGFGSRAPAGKYAHDAFTDRFAEPKGMKGRRCASGGAATAETEHAQEASACSTQDMQDDIGMGHFTNKHDDHEGMDAGGVGPGQYCDADSADARNSTDDRPAALLYHITVADLAAAIKTLAEVVARGGQGPA